MHTKYSIYTLPNGMRVILVPTKGSVTTSVFVYCKVGSRNETKQLNGASHFVEHLMFKGTPRRPTTLAVSQELEGIGAEFNAFTGKDHTGYYIKAAGKHVATMADILGDLLFHSLFDPEEVHRERTVIIEEIKMYQENPMMHIEDFHEQVAFDGSPLGWSIAGPEQTIARVSRASLFGYKQQFYHPSNMVLVVAGAVPKNIRSLVTQKFGTYKDTFRKVKIRPAKKRVAQRKIEQRKTNQTQLAISFQAFDYNHKDLAVLEVLSTLLGGSMASRLFIQVRERKGLCYYIKSDVVTYEDAGLLAVYSGVASNRTQEAISEIRTVLLSFTERQVSKEELQRAKEYLKGKLILRLEASEKMAQWFGQEALFLKHIKKPEERLKEIERVRASDVLRVARAVITPSKANAAAIGPFSQRAFVTMFRNW